MYLEIIVIVVVSCVGVVHGEEEAPFMCPSCRVAGDSSDCDAEIQDKPCNKKDPVCVMGYFAPDKHTQRFCSWRREYLGMKEACESIGECAVTMCDTSGCMAEAPSDSHFMCPYCLSWGEASHCDAIIQNEFCYGEDPVCVMKTFYDGLEKMTRRFCTSRERYLAQKRSCESSDTDCTIAMCDTSGCMAEFSSA